jgi:hypothetical protein
MLMKKPLHYYMSELRYGFYSVNSGVASTTLVLNNIVGNVPFLFFTVKQTSLLYKDGYFQFTPITNFAILDNTSTNIVGGQALPSTLVLNLLSKDWCESSYLQETALGLTNNNSYVYLYSFCKDPVNYLKHGVR